MNKIFSDLIESGRVRNIGVYKNLPENQYHADLSASNSWLKKLAVGPSFAWKNSPLDPNKEEKDTKALVFGRATHCLYLEGQAAFDSRFAILPDKSEYPDLIDTAEDMKELLRENGLKVSGKKDDLAERLKEHEIECTLWGDIIGKFYHENEGKEFISKGEFDDLMIGFNAIKNQPNMQNIWENGHSEVSIFFEFNGFPVRTRLDRWCPGVIPELKTIANQYKKPFGVACRQQITNEWYHMQAVIHRSAVIAALSMSNDMWHGFEDEEIEALKAGGEPDVNFIFLGKAAPDNEQLVLAPQVPIDYSHFEDGTPVNGEVIREESLLYMSGENAFNHLLSQYGYWMEKCGLDKPWFISKPPIGIRDNDAGLSSFSLNRDQELEGAELG